MRLLITESSGFSEEAIVNLENAGFVVEKRELDYDGLEDIIGNYDVLVIRLGIKIDRELIEKGRQLKLIATLTTGLDHFDAEAVEEKGVRILSLKGERE